MQILSINLRNIKSHRDTELTFSAGINVLSGPNGAGKSTIFEAIGYALFGVDARDFVSNVDRFLSIGSKKGEVSLVFRADDGETYRVSRTVGAGAKWLLARETGSSFEVEDHASMEETGARVAELLGLDNGRPLAEQFKLVIGPFQNDFLGPFVIRQPTRRQEAFDEILGIDAWRKTYKGTSSLLSAVQERIRILNVEVAGKNEQLELLPQMRTELAKAGADRLARQKELKEQESALSATEARLADMDALDKAIAALGSEVQLLESRIRDGSAKIIEQKTRVGESQKARQVVDGSRGGKELFEKVEADLDVLRREDKRRRELELEVAGLEKEMLRLTQLLQHERGEVEAVGRQLDEEQAKLTAAREELQADAGLSAVAGGRAKLQQELERLRGERSLLGGRRESLLEGRGKLAEGVCPFFQEECRNIDGSASRDVFSSRIAELDRQAGALDERISLLNIQLKDSENAEKELSSRTVRLGELDRQAAGLEERRSRIRGRSEGLGAIISQQAGAGALLDSRRDELKKSFQGLDDAIALAEKERLLHQPARDAYTANQNVALELEARQQQLQKMENLLLDLSENLKGKQAQLTEKRDLFQPALFQELRQEKEKLLGAVATIRQQIIDLGSNAERLGSEIARLDRIQQEVVAKQAEISAYENKEKLVKFLRNQIFKNVSGQLSERFREEISLRADRIYRTIAETDEELFWGENYQVVLRDMDAGSMRERSDDQLSGGQMMSAVVALRLALLQTIGARVAFFDEPTSNLDAARRENLAYAFRAIDVGREEVTEHWYDQLFLVSHDVAFTEITDKVIELDKDTPCYGHSSSG